MKKCPNCGSEVDENFELCWNCQYSFIDKKVLDNSDFKLICPQCSAEITSSFSYCPKCNCDLRKINNHPGEKNRGPKFIDCLRCKVPLEYQGNYKFHEGTRIGVFGDLFELLTNRESFDLFYCPNCGKVEFFLPGFDKEE